MATPERVTRMLSGLMSRWMMLRAVGVLQGAGHVQGDVDGVADRQPAEPVEQGVGAGAVHEFEDEVVFAGSVVLAAVEGADDVGVVEQLAAFGLAAETVDVALAAGQLVVQHLDGDLGVFALLPAEVHDAHTAFAEPPQEAVVAEAAQIVQRVGRPAGRPGRVQVGVIHALSRRTVPFFGGAPICSVQTGRRSAGFGGNAGTNT